MEHRRKTSFPILKFFSNQNHKIKIGKMKKMHISFYALFQFASAESPTTTLFQYATTESVTSGNPVTENSTDCPKADAWGMCVCNDDQFRKGFSS